MREILNSEGCDRTGVSDSYTRQRAVSPSTNVPLCSSLSWCHIGIPVVSIFTVSNFFHPSIRHADLTADVRYEENVIILMPEIQMEAFKC